jgi:hypothetical protein
MRTKARSRRSNAWRNIWPTCSPSPASERGSESICADKLHNLRSIRRDFEAHGEAVWSRFKRGYAQQKWYYTQIAENLGINSTFPLLETLRAEVKSFFSR